jgi:aryl sulfotransferase
MPERAGKIDWLASYPKSGNTWLRIMLANYFSEADEPHDINEPGVTNGIASSRQRFDEFLGLQSSDLTAEEVRKMRPHVYRIFVEQNPLRQWVKAHDAQICLKDGRWLFPPELSGVAIYLIRNPLDVAVSLAFHDGHEDMARTVARLCDPNAILGHDKSRELPQFTGSWSAHVASWVDQREIPVLVVRYEDMLANAAEEFAKVIRFARPGIDIEPARIKAAVAHARFENLQKAESVERFRETPSRAKRFFRNGKAGDWRNYLLPDQVAQLIDCHREAMERFGYDTILEEA